MAREAFLILINYHSNKADCIDCGKKDIISQHTKGTPTISAPSIYSTTCNPYWVHCKKGRTRHGCGHSDSTTNRYSPSKDLKTKACSIAFIILSDPIKYTMYYVIHLSSRRCECPLISTIVSRSSNSLQT